MESKKESQEFASIDENPVTSRSIDTNLARKNLQKLQEHVNRQFSNVSSSSPCAARVIGSNTGQHQQLSYLSSSGLDLIQRPPSIKNEDDLFRGESDSNHSGDGSEKQTQNSEINVLLENDQVKSTNSKGINRAESGFESPGAAEAAVCTNIPNFGELGLSFSRSLKGSDPADNLTAESKAIPEVDKDLATNKSETGKDEVKTEGAKTVEESSRSIVDFRGLYRSKSDIKEKRKRFSQRDDFAIEEIPVFDEDSQAPVRKSNSLPDLILSLSSSNSSPRSGSDRQSPDVVFRGHQDDNETDNQRDRKTLKDSFEGKSSFEKPDTDDADGKKKKLSFRRSVSFNEKTHCRYFHEGEPAVSPGVFDESIENPLQDNKHSVSTMQQKSDDKAPDQKDIDSRQSPKPVEGRRQLYSKSSGYQTGSDHSQESHDTQNGSFDKADDDRKSKETQMHYLGVDDRIDASKVDSENFKSDMSQSSSSNDTILASIIDESDRYMNDLKKASLEEQNRESDENTSVQNPTPELPFLSIMDKSPQSSLNNYRVEKKSIADDNEDIVGGIKEDSQKNGEPIQEHLLMKPIQSAEEFRRSQSTLGQSMPGSIPNLPKLGILDESVVLGPSMLAKVEEVDNQQEEHVRRKYAGGSGTTGTQALEESLAAMMSRQSLSSYLQPNTLMVQEFEQILIDNADNEPEKFTAAIHKLLESSSSSPGHSPFECGEGHHSTGSPRNKLLTVEELERASRCTDTTCTEKACEKMRQVNVLLKLDVDETHTLTNLMLTHFLEAIYLHSENCEDIMCPVLYCQKCLEWCSNVFDPNRLLEEIRAHLKNPLNYLKQQSQPRFIKLQDSISDTVPEQFITYIPLSFLQESCKILLIQDLQQQKLCVVKQYPLFEDNHQVHALETLRNLDHPHLVSLLWMLEFTDENVLQICSQFMQGGSLREYLVLSGKLPWLQAAIFLKQMTDAVCFLQEKRIVYLNWQSDNMMFPDTGRDVIKISDFGFSHCLDGDPDLGALKQCLPVYLCPPELLNDNTVCEKSDCWGLACLLAEMLTGIPPWYELRHEDRETAHKKISSNKIPHVENPSTGQEIIFKNCWQLNPAQRCTIQKLDKFLGTVLTQRS